MGLGKGKVMRYARAYLDEFNISGDARTFESLENSFGEVDMTGWGNSIMQTIGHFRNVGVRGFQALFNDDTGGSFPTMKDAGQEGQVSILFGTNAVPAVGNTAYLLDYAQIGAGARFDGGAGIIEANFLANVDGNMKNPLGWVLYPETTLGGNFTGGTVDTTSTTNSTGWAANLHVITGAGSYTFIIQDSPNGSTWATLGTFTLNGGTAGSEHLSGVTACDRYVRINGTGSGAAKIVATFARNEISS